MKTVASLVAALLLLFCVTSARAQWPPPCAPAIPALQQLPPGASARQILDAFVGAPYRNDGAVDLDGQFVLFADPATRFDSPGLNCSGFVVAALRLLLREPYSLQQAKIDRLEDSGPGASMGQDWDFGWDVLFNLLKGRSKQLVMPQGLEPLDPAALAQHDGTSLRGFPLTDRQAWRQVLATMQPGTIVLAGWSKPTDWKGYTLLHHHMALILPLDSGERWYYHAVGKRGVERIGLHTPEGLSRLLELYPESPLGVRRALLVATPLN